MAGRVPTTEEEVLFAVLEGDEQEAERLLSDFYPNELRQFIYAVFRCAEIAQEQERRRTDG